MEDKFQFKGRVTYQKIVKAQDPTLVLFKLKLIDHDHYNSMPTSPTSSDFHSQLIEDSKAIQKDLSSKIDSSKEFSALIARKPLTFLLEVSIDDIIIIYGHFNHKEQFITEKYLVVNKQKPAATPPHLTYPTKKDKH